MLADQKVSVDDSSEVAEQLRKDLYEEKALVAERESELQHLKAYIKEKLKIASELPSIQLKIDVHSPPERTSVLAFHKVLLATTCSPMTAVATCLIFCAVAGDSNR